MTLFDDLANMLDPPREEGDLVWYCSREDCNGLPHEGVNYRHARAKQHPPPGDWYLWLIQAGRGFGKTRTGGEWLVDRMRRAPGTFWALVAPTFDDGRDTMVEGESGLLFVLDSHKIRHEWNRSMGQLVIANGARIDLFSSEKPESLRGPNLTGAWGDEPATWSNPMDVWDNLQLMTRVGDPKIVLTGTPRQTKFVKKISKEADYVTEGDSYENRDNLSEQWFNRVVKPFEGTLKGQQEIYGKILEEVAGALWIPDQIDFCRVEQKPKRFSRLVVAVDPSVSHKKRDECGIAIGGINNGHGYLLADLSVQASPDGWAQIVADAYDEYEADAVIGEVNNGGDLVRTVIQNKRRGLRFQEVHASRGKTTRAEPVAAAYGDPSNPETWKDATIHHVGADFVLLEEEQCTWVQGDPDSPNRLDALVWLFAKLLGLESKSRRGRGGMRYRK